MKTKTIESRIKHRITTVELLHVCTNNANTSNTGPADSQLSFMFFFSLSITSLWMKVEEFFKTFGSTITDEKRKKVNNNIKRKKIIYISTSNCGKTSLTQVFLFFFWGVEIKIGFIEIQKKKQKQKKNLFLFKFLFIIFFSVGLMIF